MDKNTILETLKDIKPVLTEKYGVTELALFGSYSRGGQTEKSDIDVMVSFSFPLGFEYFDLVDELKNTFKPKEVQVVSKKAIKPKYFDAIKKDLLYA